MCHGYCIAAADLGARNQIDQLTVELRGHLLLIEESVESDNKPWRKTPAKGF